jgi:DNA-binding transcriptional LysR family regulator
LDTKHLKCFLTVARLLNFGEAAKVLNYSQSTVSDQIRSLEQQLGVKLFERLGKNVFLSNHGKQLIPLAERMVRDEEKIEGLFAEKGEITGSLTIGAAESLCVFWLPPVLKAYRSCHPHVQVIIKVGSCLEFHQWLQQNIVDVAFSLNDEAKNSQLRQIRLFRGETVFIASPLSNLSKRAMISPQDLEDQILILPEAECGYRRELENVLSRESVQVSAVMEFSSLEAIKQCVKSDLGVSLLPEISVSEEIERGELVVLNWVSDSISIEASMVFHREKWMSPSLTALQEVVMSSISE